MTNNETPQEQLLRLAKTELEEFKNTKTLTDISAAIGHMQTWREYRHVMRWLELNIGGFSDEQAELFTRSGKFLGDVGETIHAHGDTSMRAIASAVNASLEALQEAEEESKVS